MTSRRAPANRSVATRPAERQPHEIADAIRDAVLGHPAVARLDGGTFGVIATHAPGRRVIGVQATGEGRPVEIGVVLRLDRPLPGVIAELRGMVRAVVGDVEVDVTVSDVVPAEAPSTPQHTEAEPSS